MSSFKKSNLNKIKNLASIFKSKDFEDLFEKTLEEEMIKPKNKSGLYEDIVNHYFMLLNLLGIDVFNSFHFPDLKDCHRVNVDEIEYDFDSLFRHDDVDATNSLCAIDCLIADLDENNIENVLGKIEKRINEQNRKVK